MNIFKKSLRRSSVILFTALFISLLGVRAFLHMPRSLFPEVNYPRVVVSVNLGFAPLQNMEWGITSILEKELRAVPGVRQVRSSTSRGTSTIQIYLREGEDITLAIQRVSSKIAEVRSLIPSNAQISVRPISASAFAGAEYCFTSPNKDSRELRNFVEYAVKPLILVLPGIFNAKVFGGDLPEFSIALDPSKMLRRNLTASDVDDRLKNSNTVDFIGPVNKNGQDILAFGGKFVKSAEEIENVVVDSSLGEAVRLKDIGKVQLVNAWKYKDLSLNGQECVALDIFYQENIDQKLTSRAVTETIHDIIQKNPGDYQIRSWDLNDFTDTATDAVLLDLVIGMLIIGVVTFLFLRNLLHSVFALVVMPLAATFTFFAMNLCHLTINLMTLGGLTAAIGLVVDNTVIILEMFHHQRSVAKEISTKDLLLSVLRSVTKPMLFGTATIALVFTPIGLLSGISGMFFEPMAAVNGLSLSLSVVIALFIVPALILLFDKSSKRSDNHNFEDGRLFSIYNKILSRVLRYSRPVTLLFLVVPLLALLLLPLAKTGFLPEWDEGDMVIDYRATQPFGLTSTVQKIRPLEDYLKKIPEIDFFIRKSGTSLGEADKVPYRGEIIAKLKKHRAKSVFTLREEIGAEAEKLMPGFELDLFQILPDRLNDLSGAGKPIVIHLRGSDDKALDDAAEKYKNAISGIRGLASVRVDEPEKSPEINFTIDSALSRALDLSPTAIIDNARFGLFYLDSSIVQVGPQAIPIRLRMDKKYKVSELEELPLYTTRGGLERLGGVGTIATINSRVESNHIDGQPIRSVTAELAGRDLGSVVADIKTTLESIHLPGIYYDLAGEYRTQQQSFKELIMAFLTGLGLIFMTSLFFSNRIKVATVLSLCSLVPPAVGLAGCVLFQIPLDVSSFSGLISVSGIAVANSYMALFAIEADADIRTHSEASILRGMLGRLRPILMTNLAAMAGFIPIAIGLSPGDEILRPFSISVIIGLFGALYTTLLLMPAMYSKFCKLGPYENQD